MKIVDLTMSISEETPVYPGDPKAKIQQVANLEKEGWNEKSLTFNSHFSTHIDAPFHMVADGKKLDEFPLETFVGNAIVIDIKNQNPIKETLNNLPTVDFLFFYTGQTEKSLTDFL